MVDFYTVTEYAELTGKDTGNIRRMLIKGDLIGEKVGRQWLIPKDAVIPEDRRVKTGNYRNWRKKVTVNQQNPSLMRSLHKMCVQLSETYGNTLEKIVLYGSYARGEETPESDVDIAVILKSGNTEEMHNKMVDIVVDYELDLAVTLSVVPIEYDQYIEWNKTLPFYKNVEKEGIILWKAV
ncbi:nucleotidyltransferase domain-containing protein [Pseudobutyrivibrio xylanivorans]|uniref:DNA binding domain-containing protein, excisionase family n=1 Tax=Pseudobutyrivibrio xylanivorans DSM 14809 TaxID=1123012 RepID=A0A1M6JWF1_PSEXY|nr:nucleotidyltransferase domain-containing protein [Pseudobutyrivibrio xylanivorans]SHJ51032.1 DNA binding domain-containing protein, excisionase family [Pseudobutyrivibrio xylanivorans DSM 14809]